MFDSGESIIELYKKALEAKKNNKEILAQEVSNSLEFLDGGADIDSKPEAESSNDPLEKFLFKLTSILKENKKSEDPYLIKEISQSIENKEYTKEKIEIKTEEKSEDIKKNIIINLDNNTEENVSEEAKEENNSLEKFLFKLNDILTVNKKESIKNSALSLIEQLKNKEDSNVKELEIPPQPETGKVPNTSPPLSVVKKTPKPLPVKKKEDNKDLYIKELENISKDSLKNSKETEEQKIIKEEVQKQVKEFLGKFRNGVVSEGGGGGGNYSTEFKNGGTMNGSLNVTGQYLSAGVPLTNIFGSGGGGASDRLIAELQQLILNSDGTITFPDDTIRTSDGKLLSIEAETLALSSFTKIALSGNAFYAYDSNGNAITFDTTDNEILLTTQGTNSWTFRDDGKFSGPNNVLEIQGNLNTSNKILSGGVDLANIFLTQETDSQTLSWNATAYELSISNGNTVSLASLSSTGGGSDRNDVNTVVISNSANWINTTTFVQSNSSTWATEEFAVAMSIGLS